MSITYQKLSSRIQNAIKNEKELKKLDAAEIALLLRYCFLLIGEALANGEDIYLEGFGRFRPDCKPPRKIKSWITDKTHTTDYKVFVKFTAFKQLNAQVQKFMSKIGFVANFQEEDMKPILLPHLRNKEDVPAEEPFETMEKEIAKRFSQVHPTDNQPYTDDPSLPRTVKNDEK